MIIKNIETKIRLASLVSIGSLVSALLICLGVCFFCYLELKESRKTVYILDGASIPVLARQSEVQINRPAEYRAHISRFHQLFFSLSPDDQFIQQQMKAAMYLVDESGVLQYNNLKESGFFNSVLSSSAILSIRTDSIYLDMNRKYFRYYGTQQIDRRSLRTTRSLITEGYLRDLEMRSDNNPHAALILRWKTLENKDLSNVQKNPF